MYTHYYSSTDLFHSEGVLTEADGSLRSIVHTCNSRRASGSYNICTPGKINIMSTNKIYDSETS